MCPALTQWRRVHTYFLNHTPQEAALAALHGCASRLPSAALQPHAQSLHRLTVELLEQPATPPALLGPLLRLLLAALPAVPLSVVGQGFGDVADLLCGWALEQRVEPADRWGVGCTRTYRGMRGRESCGDVGRGKRTSGAHRIAWQAFGVGTRATGRAAVH